jgi:hypothetical protein
MELTALGRVLLVVGLAILVIGILLIAGDRLPFIGRLPGDFVVKGDRWTFYAPIGTSILISVVLSLGLLIFGVLAGRRE